MTDSDSPPQPELPRADGRRVNWRVRGGIAGTLFVVGVAILAQDWWSGRSPVDSRVAAEPDPVAAALANAQAHATETAEAHAQRLEHTHGIRIEYGDPANFWAPPFKAEDAAPPGLEMTPAEPGNVAASLIGIEAALQQYPPGFVAKLIKAVFICGALRMQGEPASGMALKGWVILASRTEYGPEGLRDLGFVGLHHELSSFVLRADPGTWAKWAEFAPAGRQYWDDPAGSLRHADDPDPPLETGFLNAYGATNLENDFNIYAEEMFRHPANVARLAQRYPLIRRKLDFVMATYAALDPAIRETFRQLGLTGS